MTQSSSRPIRWWPAAIIVAGVITRFAWLLLTPTEDQQSRTFALGGALLLGFFLLLLWALLFSRLTGRAKLKTLGGTIAALVVFFTLFRIEEVSGNLVPILSFRWAGETKLEAGGRTAAVSSSADDYPQFLGAQRDGTVSHIKLARNWQEAPPKELWRRPVGTGQSGFAVVGDAAVTFEQREGQQVVVRYELESGDVVWSHGLPGSFETVIGGKGPRSTPTISDGIVYAFGPLGTLRALDLTDGRQVWTKNVANDFSTKPPEWGYASSPLVFDSTVGRLVVVALGVEGAALVAFHAETGDLAWQGGDDRVGYSSPSLVQLAGQQQILIFNGASLSAHASDTGSVLWSFPWSGQQPNVAMPLVLGDDKVLISSGYGIGAALLQVADSEQGWQVTEVWKSPRLKAKFTNPVVHEGTVYGLDDGVLTCLEPADGSRCWKKGRYGHGQNILVGDLLLVQTEDGQIVLVEASPEKHQELARLEALTGKSWNPPALAGRYLLVRNSKEAVCYELPLG